MLAAPRQSTGIRYNTPPTCGSVTKLAFSDTDGPGATKHRATTSGARMMAGSPPRRLCMSPLAWWGLGSEPAKPRPGTREKPADPIPRRRVRNTDAFGGRADPGPARGHRVDHVADRIDAIQTADQHEARDQRVRHRAPPALPAADPNTVTHPAGADRTPIARPEPHSRAARRAIRSRHHGRLTGGRVHIDGIGARPYDGHQCESTSEPLSARVPTSVGRGPSRTRTRTSSPTTAARHQTTLPLALAPTSYRTPHQHYAPPHPPLVNRARRLRCRCRDDRLNSPCDD
jgi:hypothetical protein